MELQLIITGIITLSNMLLSIIVLWQLFTSSAILQKKEIMHLNGHPNLHPYVFTRLQAYLALLLLLFFQIASSYLFFKLDLNHNSMIDPTKQTYYISLAKKALIYTFVPGIFTAII